MYKLFGKRLFDVVVSSVVILLTAPLLVLLAGIIRLRLGSPILFFQERGGFKGRVFWLMKFRSMTDEKNENGELLTDAERLPAFGQWLRKTSLDELPELWNVLKGDMSLVGPRPFIARYLEHYSEEERRRHDVRPGLTGLAQILGRNALTWQQKFAYDCKYVDEYNFTYDLWILLKTISAVMIRDGITDSGTETAAPFVPLQTSSTYSGNKSTDQEFFSPQRVLKKSRWPHFDSDQINSVVNVLKSGCVNYWTGQEILNFEKEFAEKFNVRHAVAVANGTVAIEASLRALEVGAGDEVVVPSRTFIGTASAVVQVGATPVVADIEKGSQALSVSTIEAALTTRTKAVIVVHVGGWPADMVGICKFAKEKGIHVIEDCAQAHGAKINERYVGSFGDIASFSFCQDKIMTTGGEGGLVITNNQELWEKIWRFKDHGKKITTMNRNSTGGVFQFVHDDFGTNLRMTEMQAAIGRLQLKRLDDWVQTRIDNANYIINDLRDVVGIEFPQAQSDYKNSFYRLYGFVDESLFQDGWNRDRIVKELVRNGVGVGVGSSGEIYREKAFNRFGQQKIHHIAHDLNKRSLAFLVHPTMRQEELDTTCQHVKRVFENAIMPRNAERNKAA